MKKWLIMALCVLLAASAVMPGALGEAEMEGYTLPLANPEDNVTITAWGFPLPEWKVDDLENNQFTQWLQEQTGITIEWVMGPATDRDEKLNLLLSSGEYPEIIFNAPFDPSQQQIYGDMGVILPLNEYIEKYGVETQRIFEEVPDIKNALVRNNGDQDFQARFVSVLRNQFLRNFLENVCRTEERVKEMYCVYIVQGMLAMVSLWLDTGMRETPEQMAKLGGDFIMRGVKGLR